MTGKNHGSYDYWVVKLSEKGAIQWQRLLGGSAWDAGYSVDQTTDGGYVLVGSSASSKSGDVTGTNHGVGGSDDIWVVKLDANDATRWQRLLGGDRDDYGESVDTTADGGYVLFGSTYSNRTGQVTGTSRGGQDFWIVKLSDRGRLEWQKLLGGGKNDEGYAAHQMADGKYILLGASISSAGGDVTETSNGGWDFWAVKLNPAPILPVTVFTAAAAPHDLDEDGLYEDVNGNAKAEFADIILFFQQMNWIAGNEPVELFDDNRNGGIDFADLIWLFQHL